MKKLILLSLLLASCTKNESGTDQNQVINYGPLKNDVYFFKGNNSVSILAGGVTYRDASVDFNLDQLTYKATLSDGNGTQTCKMESSYDFNTLYYFRTILNGMEICKNTAPYICPTILLMPFDYGYYEVSDADGTPIEFSTMSMIGCSTQKFSCRTSDVNLMRLLITNMIKKDIALCN